MKKRIKHVKKEKPKNITPGPVAPHYESPATSPPSAHCRLSPNPSPPELSSVVFKNESKSKLSKRSDSPLPKSPEKSTFMSMPAKVEAGWIGSFGTGGAAGAGFGVGCCTDCPAEVFPDGFGPPDVKFGRPLLGPLNE